MQTGTPDACYAILERRSHGWSVTFRYVPYDHMAMAELARRYGLADLPSALATGWVRRSYASSRRIRTSPSCATLAARLPSRV